MIREDYEKDKLIENVKYRAMGSGFECVILRLAGSNREVKIDDLVQDLSPRIPNGPIIPADKSLLLIHLSVFLLSGSLRTVRMVPALLPCSHISPWRGS